MLTSSNISAMSYPYTSSNTLPSKYIKKDKKNINSNFPWKKASLIRQSKIGTESRGKRLALKANIVLYWSYAEQ